MRSNQQGKRRLIVIVILIVAVALLVGIVFFKHAREKHRYLPILNLHPKNFITISGKIDPRLNGAIIAIYETENEKCFIVTNVLEGANYPRQTQFIYPIKTKNHTYSLKLPVDKLLAGQCKWMLNGFFYRAQYNNLSDKSFIFAFNKKNVSLKKKYHANVTCKINKLESKSYLDCSPALNYHFLLPKNSKNITINSVLYGVKNR